MPEGAPRRPSCPWRRLARGALTALGLWLAAAGTAVGCRDAPLEQRGVLPSSIVQAEGYTAWYADPTRRYAHAVLGDDREPTTLGILHAGNSASCGVTVTLRAPLVFEDVAPRLADLTGDGVPEIITVRSHAERGAQLAIYTLTGNGRELTLLAATPHIGMRFRWLAPVGAADFDGDGDVEVAFVDRPHLDRTLRIWRYTGEAFLEIARMPGLTNHRIGEAFITGGVRDCGDGPEMILVAADWTWIMAVRMTSDHVAAARVARFAGPSSVARVMECR